MIKYVGIDPSITCTGLSVVSMNKDNLFTLIDKKIIVPGKKSRGFDKKLDSLSAFKWATENLSSFKDVKFFVFENYSYGSPGHLADLGEMTGMFKHHISNNLKLPFDVIAPASVKKIITGSGKATKQEVRDSLSKYISNISDISWNTFDESDATAIAVAYGIIHGTS